MKTTITLCCLVALAIMFGCNSGGNAGKPATNPVGDTASTDSTKNAMADSVRKNLRGASFGDTIRIVKLYTFSRNDSADTFELKVPPGPIAVSTATMTIKTMANTIIFSVPVPTYFFVRDIFDQDTTSARDQDEFERHQRTYTISLTRSQFEAFAEKRIKEFFYDGFSDNNHLDSDAGEPTDNKELYEEVKRDSTIKVFWLPCFDCDEGASCYAYSRKEGKAIVIATSD